MDMGVATAADDIVGRIYVFLDISSRTRCFSYGIPLRACYRLELNLLGAPVINIRGMKADNIPALRLHETAA